MGANSELMIRMSEEEFYRIPPDIRQSYLSSKMVTPELNDWSELMQDEHYSVLYYASKKVKQNLEQRAYDLREKKRENLRNNLKK
jgi:hypothetical protein